MPTIHQEAERFFEFVKRTVPSEEAGPSLEECMRQWREEQEMEATIAAVKRGEEYFAAGRCMSLDEAERRLRSEVESHADVK